MANCEPHLGPDGKRFQIELQSDSRIRGLPGADAGRRSLGVTSRRAARVPPGWLPCAGGRLLLAFSLARPARQDWIPRSRCMDGNILFAAGGVFLLWQMASGDAF